LFFLDKSLIMDLISIFATIDKISGICENLFVANQRVPVVFENLSVQ
jgi:hypothetical protein